MASIMSKIELMIFLRYVLEHLVRISRVLKQAGGNALLVGVGGSGRQSLSRLAAAISDFHVFQPEISKSYGMTEWREDIKVRGYGFHEFCEHKYIFGGYYYLKNWLSSKHRTCLCKYFTILKLV